MFLVYVVVSLIFVASTSAISAILLRIYDLLCVSETFWKWFIRLMQITFKVA